MANAFDHSYKINVVSNYSKYFISLKKLKNHLLTAFTFESLIKIVYLLHNCWFISGFLLFLRRDSIHSVWRNPLSSGALNRARLIHFSFLLHFLQILWRSFGRPREHKCTQTMKTFARSPSLYYQASLHPNTTVVGVFRHYHSAYEHRIFEHSGIVYEMASKPLS